MDSLLLPSGIIFELSKRLVAIEYLIVAFCLLIILLSIASPGIAVRLTDFDLCSGVSPIHTGIYVYIHIQGVPG